MKKNVFFALFACAALVFVGCEPNTPTPTPDGGSTTDAVISVTPETLLMAAGETQKLTATVAPQGTQLQITWTSDNQEVVTVSPAGIVTAVAAGQANIIASAEGATADTCVVTVSNDAILDNFELGGVGLFGDIQLIPGFDTVISGYNCQLGYIELIAWDANLVFVDGQGFAGDGYVIVADEFPMYWVVENGEVLGYIGSEQGYFISEEVKGVSPYAAPAGKMVDLQKYGDAWKGLYFATTDAEAEAAVELYQESQTGTQVLEMYDGQIYIYAAANVKYAQLLQDPQTEELYYNLQLGWYDFVNMDRWYGLACTYVQNEEGKYQIESFVEPYDLRVIDKEYANIPAQEINAKGSTMTLTTKNLYLGQNPVGNIKNTKVMYKK